MITYGESAAVLWVDLVHLRKVRLGKVNRLLQVACHLSAGVEESHWIDSIIGHLRSNLYLLGYKGLLHAGRVRQMDSL